MFDIYIYSVAYAIFEIICTIVHLLGRYFDRKV